MVTRLRGGLSGARIPTDSTDFSLLQIMRFVIPVVFYEITNVQCVYWCDVQCVYWCDVQCVYWCDVQCVYWFDVQCVYWSDTTILIGRI